VTKQLSIPNQPWTESIQSVCDSLAVSVEQGLDGDEARRRQEQYGSNRLREAQRRSPWEILIVQFKSLVVLLLVAAAAVSFIFGEWIDGIAIMVVVLINAAIGFVTEVRAVRSMEALQEMSQVTTRVRRNGEELEIPARELVPGDIVILDAGDIVTADLRLLEALKLQSDEAALIGESVPVAKQVEPVDREAPLAERNNMVFKGTSITRGAGEGVVVATGLDTELGEISTLVAETEDEETPLEQRLEKMGQKLIWLTVGTAAVVAVVGIIRNRELLVMIETAVALAVAAIPEGLPIVATITLARGMHRMASRNALVNRLAAVETLGGTNIICTDKTGTLTENQMTVIEFLLEKGKIEVEGEGLTPEGEFKHKGETIKPADDDLLRQTLEVGALCSNAYLSKNPEKPANGNGSVGDPMEVALLVAAAKAGLERDDLLERMPEEREETFDPESNMMATFHHQSDGYRVAVKGAPEAVLDACTHLLTNEGVAELAGQERKRWLARNQKMAEDGLRVLALAQKTVGSAEAEPYSNLTFLGLAGLLDPPRAEVRESIAACRRAGIRVVMVTGDQPMTARHVGQAVGLPNKMEAPVIEGQEFQEMDSLDEHTKQRVLEAPILARISPEQKLTLIELHRQNGDIVAMTGDGVNDAPALKKANIGVAMGRRGTQVAREAADMVLQDDAFSTIIVAVEQGRIIFNNIRKFIIYHLSGNMSEIIAVALASLLNAPLPLLPLQILFLNIGIDVFPALALGVGESSPGIMARPPRDPAEPIMTRRHWAIMGGYGLILALTILGALGLAVVWFGMDIRQAVTVSFLTLALAKLWHVLNMREQDSGFIKNEITANPYVWGALVICAGLILAAVYLPGLATVLKVVNPGGQGWALAAVMSLIPFVIGQLLKLTHLTEL